jgi:hypothetical protein
MKSDTRQRARQRLDERLLALKPEDRFRAPVGIGAPKLTRLKLKGGGLISVPHRVETHAT